MHCKAQYSQRHHWQASLIYYKGYLFQQLEGTAFSSASGQSPKGSTVPQVKEKAHYHHISMAQPYFSSWGSRSIAEPTVASETEPTSTLKTKHLGKLRDPLIRQASGKVATVQSTGMQSAFTSRDPCSRGRRANLYHRLPIQFINSQTYWQQSGIELPSLHYRTLADHTLQHQGLCTCPFWSPEKNNPKQKPTTHNTNFMANLVHSYTFESHTSI